MTVTIKWLQSRFRRRQVDLSPEPRQVERDSGEEHYESREEDDREVGDAPRRRFVERILELLARPRTPDEAVADGRARAERREAPREDRAHEQEDAEDEAQ